MHPVVRIILGVLAGILISFVIVACVEAVNVMLFPLPKGIDFTDRQALKAAIAGMPRIALVVVLAGWGLGALAGTLTAAKITRSAALAVVVGALLLTAAILNMASLPHPLWFWVVGVAIYPVATWLGIRLAGGGSPAPQPAQT